MRKRTPKRPPKDPKFPRLSVRIPIEQRARLEKAAKDQNYSDIIRKGVDLALAELGFPPP